MIIFCLTKSFTIRSQSKCMGLKLWASDRYIIQLLASYYSSKWGSPVASQTSRTFSPSLASTSPVVSLSMNLAGSETVAKITLIEQAMMRYEFTSVNSNLQV